MAVGMGVDVLGPPEGPLPRVTRRLVQTLKVRKILEVTGRAQPCQLVVHNGSLTNLVKGVSERVLGRKVNGTWVSTQVNVNLSNTFDWYHNHVVRMVGTVVPLTQDRFLQQYSGVKKSRYSVAFLSLIDPLRREDSECKVFVKADKSGIGKTPRIISPRTDRYHVSLGRYIGAIEKHIFRAVDNILGTQVVLKGANAFRRAEIIVEHMSKPGRVAIGVDASRFDASVCPSWLRFEHQIYNSIFNDSELRLLLWWQLAYTCKGYAKEGKLKYKLKGTRASGDMNTSLGNIIIMTALIMTYMKAQNVPYDLINDGDDAVIFVHERHIGIVNGFQAWAVQYNFHIVTELPVSVIEEVEFCQCKPVWNGERYTMVRNFPLSMSKDQISVRYRDPTNARDWLYSVSMCGLNISAGIPINQNFYTSLAPANGKFIKDNAIKSGLYYLQRGIKQIKREITPRSRYSFWKAFGVLPDHQVAMETTLSSLPSINITHTHRQVEQDYSGEYELVL